MRKFMRTRAAAPPAPPAPPPPLQHNGHAPRGSGGDASAASPRWYGGVGGGSLHEDGEFPVSWRSLGERRLSSGVRWLRPHELCARPHFRGEQRAAPSPRAHTEHTAHEDYDDDDPTTWCVEAGGALGAGGAAVCAAAAALSLAPRLLERAVPPQSFVRGYTGAFRFRFWVFGAWRDVVVDDRLPTRGGRVLGATSARPDDFTLPLLHKAYAKLYGSYAALRGASAARALQDLTGAVVQSFALRLQPPALAFQVLNSAVPRSTLLVATLAHEGGKGSRHGLLAGQAYCVTGLARVRAAGAAGEGALVRVRSLGARGAWAGAWAPHSAEWRALPPADRELLAERAPDPGDFWMSFGDFAQSFTSLELVHVGPDDWLREPALQARRPWRAVLARRRWRAGYNAGGPPSCTETAGTNPQFHVQIGRGEAAGAAVSSRKCHVVVSLTQQYGARAPAAHAVGFSVYEVSGGGGEARLHAAHEARAREVVTLLALPPGRYLVVAHTRRPHTDAAFLLRILTDEQADVWELNEDNAVVRDLAAEFERDDADVPVEVRAAGARLLRDCTADEVDAAALRAALRRVWRVCLCAAPSLRLCRALVSLRDAPLAGAMRARDLPALLALLAYWRAAFLRAASRRCAARPRASSYGLRALLWACGLTASNKVLECLVLRYARRATLTEEAYVMALARLHLAHERYRSLEAKVKACPLTLEEMILMTIYS